MEACWLSRYWSFKTDALDPEAPLAHAVPLGPPAHAVPPAPEAPRHAVPHAALYHALPLGLQSAEIQGGCP